MPCVNTEGYGAVHNTHTHTHTHTHMHTHLHTQTPGSSRRVLMSSEQEESDMANPSACKLAEAGWRWAECAALSPSGLFKLYSSPTCPAL